METRGANCLSAARAAGRRVTLGAITSAATSLGALAVQGELLQACLDQVSTAATPSLHDDNPGDDFMNFLESNSDCERVLILITPYHHIYKRVTLLSPQPERVISLEVTDQEAKAACVRFADDHRMLVEVRMIVNHNSHGRG